MALVFLFDNPAAVGVSSTQRHPFSLNFESSIVNLHLINMQSQVDAEWRVLLIPVIIVLVGYGMAWYGMSWYSSMVKPTRASQIKG